MWRPVGEVTDPDERQGLGDAGVELGAAQPEVGRPERDVVTHRRHEQLVVGVLEDDPDPAAHLQQGVRAHGQPRHGDGARLRA